MEVIERAVMCDVMSSNFKASTVCHGKKNACGRLLIFLMTDRLVGQSPSTLGGVAKLRMPTSGG
jgi:hypothetical protein